MKKKNNKIIPIIAALLAFLFPLALYWLSGKDFHRCDEFSFTFAISCVFAFMAGVFPSVHLMLNSYS
jgi:hypothetical protein